MLASLPSLKYTLMLPEPEPEAAMEVMMARALTGKPLVAHIHATEYDRSGLNINEQVAGIERAGLNAADVVVAVSRLTRKTVIERYGVAPEKVVVVHNAVARHATGVINTSVTVNEGTM